MNLLYSGFDGLDVAYRCHIPKDLRDRLEVLKTKSAEKGCDMLLPWNGVTLSVASTGAQGGYAYRCHTGDLGAIFWFKKHSGNDPWGVRVSVRALTLATMGLSGAKAYVETILEELGCCLGPQAESIGRVDLAFDYLAPDFELNQNQFVMHARCNRKTHFDIDSLQENGRSGRTTSVTIGKNPRQQVIVYDKRDEVISKGKAAWPEIWNTERRKSGAPDLDMSDPRVSRVWRVELRAHKAHIKEVWGVTTWHDLSTNAEQMFSKMIEDVRYTAPSSDTNRARWPNHELWEAVRSDLVSAMEGIPSIAEPEAIRHALIEERNRMLLAQAEGTMLSRLVLSEVAREDFGEALVQEAIAMAARFKEDPKRTKERMAKARAKYLGLVPASEGNKNV